MSEKSTTHNIIKLTRETASGSETFVHATRAIKQNSGRFAYIGSRRFSDLAGDRYKSNARPQDKIILCEYDPKKWTLFIHLAWSGKDRSCDATAFKEWRYKVLKLDTTKLHIFFRFLALPASTTFNDFVNGTIDPEHLRGKVTQSEYGFEDLELARWIRFADGVLDDELVSMLTKTHYGSSPDMLDTLKKWCSIGRSRHMSSNDIILNAGGRENCLNALDELEKAQLRFKSP